LEHSLAGFQSETSRLGTELENANQSRGELERDLAAILSSLTWRLTQPLRTVIGASLADLHILTQDRSTADLVLPSKLGGMLASGRNILVMADPGTELHDLLNGAAIIVPTGDVQALADAIKSVSKKQINPPPQLTHLLESFSSGTILPAFHRAIRGN